MPSPVTPRSLRRYMEMKTRRTARPDRHCNAEHRMKPSIRLALLVAVLSVATFGCRDAATAAPQPALDNQRGTEAGEEGSGSSNDSSYTPPPSVPTAPVDPAPGPDTAITPSPPRPAAFTINGVALGAESRTDTTRTVRVGGVTARLYRVKASDGSEVPETLVATTVADANGGFVFRDVATGYYRVDVAAPTGGPYVDGSTWIAPPWSTEVYISVLLHRKS
jgi:hypothetical protein